MSYKQQTLYFFLKNHITTLHSGDSALAYTVYGTSAILVAKVRKLFEIKTLLHKINFVEAAGARHNWSKLHSALAVAALQCCSSKIDSMKVKN